MESRFSRAARRYGLPAAAALAFAIIAALSANAAGWTTFTDPGEQAFTAQVPQGWIVKGGIERKSDVDVTGWMALASHDGATTMFVHDPNVPKFILPNQDRQEGSWAPNGALGLAFVMPYEPGAQFAAKYGRTSFASSCGNLQLKSSRNEAELQQRQVRQLQEMAARVGGTRGMPQIDAGSAMFTCNIKGKPYVAVAFAATSLVPALTIAPGRTLGGGWTAVVMGYRTPVASQAETDRTLRQIDASLKQQPAFQEKMVAAVRQKLEEIRENGERGMEMLQRQADEESQALRNQYEQNMQAGQERHEAFMGMMEQQRDSRNEQFDNHMYQKAVTQQNEMMYINNQHCIAWYGNDTHQGCRVYVND